MNSKKYIINIFILGFLLSFVQFSYATWVVPEDSDVSGVLKFIKGNNQNQDTMELFRCTEVQGDCEFIMTLFYEDFSDQEWSYLHKIVAAVATFMLASVVLAGVPAVVILGGGVWSGAMYGTIVGTGVMFFYDNYKEIYEGLNISRHLDYKQVYNVDFLKDDQAIIFLSDNLDEIIEELESNKLNVRALKN